MKSNFSLYVHSRVQVSTLHFWKMHICDYRKQFAQSPRDSQNGSTAKIMEHVSALLRIAEVDYH